MKAIYTPEIGDLVVMQNREIARIVYVATKQICIEYDNDFQIAIVSIRFLQWQSDWNNMGAWIDRTHTGE